MSEPGIFAGDVADHYAAHRRGYRTDVIDWLATRFGIGREAKVLDLGCGTGQLTVPLAARAGCAIGMDPSPDMLARAREGGAPNNSWLLGRDSDLPSLIPLLGKQSLSLVTIGQALHWMDPEAVFTGLRELLRPGGGVAVIANGSPVWTQNAPWVATLREISQKWLGELGFPTCGSSETERARYREQLTDAGYTDITEYRSDYSEQFSLDHFIGSFYSAAPLERLSDHQRAGFDTDLRQALAGAQPDGRFVERVHVRILAGSQPIG